MLPIVTKPAPTGDVPSRCPSCGVDVTLADIYANACRMCDCAMSSAHPSDTDGQEGVRPAIQETVGTTAMAPPPPGAPLRMDKDAGGHGSAKHAGYGPSHDAWDQGSHDAMTSAHARMVQQGFTPAGDLRHSAGPHGQQTLSRDYTHPDGRSTSVNVSWSWSKK